MRFTVAAFLLVLAASSANAACTADQAMAKSSDVSEVLMEKVQKKPDEASKQMNELGEITAVSPPTDQTCARLDALLKKAKAL